MFDTLAEEVQTAGLMWWCLEVGSRAWKATAIRVPEGGSARGEEMDEVVDAPLSVGWMGEVAGALGVPLVPAAAADALGLDDEDEASALALGVGSERLLPLPLPLPVASWADSEAEAEVAEGPAVGAGAVAVWVAGAALILDAAMLNGSGC